jgi:hypothetical protein
MMRTKNPIRYVLNEDMLWSRREGISHAKASNYKAILRETATGSTLKLNRCELTARSCPLWVSICVRSARVSEG